MKITLYKTNLKSVFILEDDQARINWFTDKFNFVTNLVITKQAGSALETLRTQKFDILFLDHDLEPDHYSAFAEGREPQMELTGLYVATHLWDTINKETPCIVHSMNPVGASNIVKAHPFNIAHIPFFMLVQALEIEQ